MSSTPIHLSFDIAHPKLVTDTDTNNRQILVNIAYNTDENIAIVRFVGNVDVPYSVTSTNGSKVNLTRRDVETGQLKSTLSDRSLASSGFSRKETQPPMTHVDQELINTNLATRGVPALTTDQLAEVPLGDYLKDDLTEKEEKEGEFDEFMGGMRRRRKTRRMKTKKRKTKKRKTIRKRR
jgi:hypothetical protein